MKRTLAAGAACLALAGAARATTYTADFSSSAVDPALTSYGTPSLVTSGGGRLTVAFSPSQAGTASDNGVFTNFHVSGDYIATAVFDINNLSASGGQNYYGAGFCGTVSGGSGDANCVAAFRDAYSDYANGFENINGVYAPSPLFSGTDVMSLRIERLGDTVTQSVSIDGGAYQTLGSYAGTEMLGDTTFALDGYSNAVDCSSGSVSFSNFTIDYTDAVPEPVSWVMMIGGLGLAGVTMRRKKTVFNFGSCAL